jgi:site-specific DNA-cytosine methylase
MRSAAVATMPSAATCCPPKRPALTTRGRCRICWGEGFDLLIAHPPCTHLAVSGSRHFHRKQQEQQEALAFVRLLMDAPIERWCIENPVSIISSAIRPPDQIIQPWEHGHGETKATCLWLKNLPQLRPTNVVSGRENRVHRMPPGPDRWKERSRTYEGVAEAMGKQWGEAALPAVVEQLLLC